MNPSKPYSVQRAETEAVRVAKVIAGHLPKETTLTSDNCLAFVDYLARVCDISYERALTMLGHFMPLKLDGLGVLRLALAIIHYLPIFDKDDIVREHRYDGVPKLWAHCKIMNTFPYTGKDSVRVRVVYLLMTSVLAGEYRLEDVSFEGSLRILRHIGMGKPRYCKEPLLPQELTGAYTYVLFGNKPNAACVPLVHEATSSEKKANKKLLRARLTVDCPRKPEGGCAQCLIGKDQCGIACRMFTKDQKHDNS